MRWIVIAAAVLLAGCASSSSTAPSADPAPTPTAPPGVRLSASFEQQVVTLVNQHRARGARCGGIAQLSVARVTTDANLGRAARDHSVDMTTHNYFSHTGRDGRMPDQRVRDSGYGGRYMGENIARGHGSPQAVVNAWMESTGHCNNIMRAESRDVGIGYASNYWTADFGR